LPSLAAVGINWSKHDSTVIVSISSLRFAKIPSLLTDHTGVNVVKVKGTKAGLSACIDLFVVHPNLAQLVRHIEIWIPIWERKADAPLVYAPAPALYSTRRIVQTFVNATTTSFEETSNVNSIYQSSSHNASVEEIFRFVQSYFRGARVLTLEGGHCKGSAKVQLWEDDIDYLDGWGRNLPVLENIRVLVLKGAWNLMREPMDFHHLMHAFPSVSEWHTAYSKPKAGIYLSRIPLEGHIHESAANALLDVARIIPDLPRNITRLNLCIEHAFCKEACSPVFWRKVYPASHICLELAKAAPQLESLTYTGRICAGFFDRLCRIIEQRGERCKLKSVDLIVKNCCRDRTVWLDGSGINNFGFIKCFEQLVTAGVKALGTLKDLQDMNIRFIDIGESPKFTLVLMFHRLISQQSRHIRS